jgi:hypothetical protein
MSGGGTFKIITNDGKQDDIIMSQKLLNRRLETIQKLKSQNPNISDPTPTISDIEKTHILFVHAQFKPYVAIANEYQILVQQKVQLGGQAQFSIPLYGDFFHDMVLHMRLGSVNATNTGDGNRLLKYVDYPGERICTKTEFSINGNPLDSYTRDVFPFHRNFQVQPNKRVGYDRNMGQQTSVLAKKTVAGGRAGTTEETWITNGHQTPKASQEALDLWIPILFWFSMDVKLSIVSVAIPHGQRFLTLDFARAEELLQHVGATSSNDNPSSNPVPVPDIEICELYVDHIFVTPEIHSIFIKQIGFNLIRVHRLQSEVLDKNENNIHLNQMKWPIETLYLGARPKVNSATNSVLMTENWHKYTVQTKNTIETADMDANAFWFDAAAALNDPATAADLDLSIKRTDKNSVLGLFTAALGALTVPSLDQISNVLALNNFKVLTAAGAAPILNNAALTAVIPNGAKTADWYASSNTLESIGFEAHGVDLFKYFPTKFYSQYLPYHYGSERISTPEDPGMLMVPFNLYPGSYQPSGHINISRAREFYLKYRSNWISSSNTADLFVIGIAINFLLISDGSAIIRYAT